MLTEKGTLHYGVEHEGKLHVDFELRMPTIGDNIAAIEEFGVDSNLKLNVAMMARCLVKLGDIPAEVINYELLANHVIDEDYDVLADARDRLKKKRTELKNTSPAIAQPSPSSANTASVSNVSGN